MNIADAELAFLCAVYDGDGAKAIAALKRGVDVNATDGILGVTALHIAVGTNNLSLTRTLVEDWNAAFKPDATGRWPTLIAAQARVDDALADYIVEAEAKYIVEAEVKAKAKVLSPA